MVFAVKVMARQLRRIDRCFSSFVEENKNFVVFPRFTTFFNDALWVMVVRRDVIRQAISCVIAQSTGFYHAVANENGFVPGNAMRGYRPDYAASVEYSFNRIMNEIHLITRDKLVWKSFFELNRIMPLTIIYEEIVDFGNFDHIAEIARQAGIQDAKKPERRNLVRMAGDKNREMYDRFCADLVNAVYERRPVDAHEML